MNRNEFPKLITSDVASNPMYLSFCFLVIRFPSFLCAFINSWNSFLLCFSVGNFKGNGFCRSQFRTNKVRFLSLTKLRHKMELSLIPVPCVSAVVYRYTSSCSATVRFLASGWNYITMLVCLCLLAVNLSCIFFHLLHSVERLDDISLVPYVEILKLNG